MSKVNPTPNPMLVLKSSGCAALAGGSMMSSMDQDTLEEATTETIERLLGLMEHRDQLLNRNPPEPSTEPFLGLHTEPAPWPGPRRLKVHLAGEWIAAPRCGQPMGRMSENLAEVTCLKCLGGSKARMKPRGQRGARLHAAPPRTDQGTAWCPGCETVLPLEFFGTYPAPKLSGKKHATCLPCRIPDTGIPDPGAGKLICAVCGFPLNTHPLGAWCFQ